MTGITPLVITYNEAPNIGRTLEQLTWADRVVVMDSGSTDETLAILARYPNVEVVHRPFDSFAGQCNAGLTHVRTPWTLSLDADYVLSQALVDEIRALPDDPAVAGYRASFVYRIVGQDLRGTLYPPRTVLYRTDRAHYRDHGHAHYVTIDGAVAPLRGKIYHDDRKSRARWFTSQSRYISREADRLLSADPKTFDAADKLRMRGLAPLVTPFYCLFAKRLILDGKAGLLYTAERTYADVLLTLELLDRYWARRNGTPVPPAAEVSAPSRPVPTPSAAPSAVQ